MVIRGHFDGRQIVLDDPVPTGVAANAPVKIVFEHESGDSALEQLARLATPGGLPADYAAQHEHYVKGTPRR